jgi:exonuclease III
MLINWPQEDRGENTEKAGGNGPQQEVQPWQVKKTKERRQENKALGASLRMIRRRKLRKAWYQPILCKTKASRRLRVITNNTAGGIGSGKKLHELEKWLQETGPDVMILQETKMTREDENQMEKRMKGYKAYWSVKENERKNGVMTILKEELAALVLEIQIVRDKDGRFLALPLRTLTKDLKMWIVNIYAPSGVKKEEQTDTGTQASADQEEQNAATERKTIKEKDKFWNDTMRTHMKKMHQHARKEDIKIFGMDANLTMEPTEDMEWEAVEKWEAKLQDESKTSVWLQNWAEENALVDIWRLQNPNTREYTRRQQNQVARRLDYLMVNDRWANAVTCSRVLHKLELDWGTDHRAVAMEVLGLPVLRELSKTEWVKPMYDHAQIASLKDQLNRGMEEWEVDGKSGAEALKDFHKRTVGVLKEEGVKQKKEWRTVGGYRAQTQEERDLTKKVEVLKKWLKGDQRDNSTVKGAIQTARRTAQQKQQAEETGKLTVGEQMVLKAQPDIPLREETSRQIILEEIRRLKAKRRKIAAAAWKQIWKSREEKARIGEKFSQWSGEMWKRAKRRKKIGMGVKRMMMEISRQDQTWSPSFENTWGKCGERRSN